MNDPNQTPSPQAARGPRMTRAHVKRRAREAFESAPEPIGRKVGRLLTGGLLITAPVGIQRFAAGAPWWVPVGAFLLGLEIASRGKVLQSLRLLLTLAGDALRGQRGEPPDGPGV